MELRHLRAFLETADAGSVMRAARRLGVGQPVLSRQIRDLEQTVGVELFTRSTHGVRLTAAGTQFLPAARALLDHALAAIADARHAAESARRTLRIAHSPLGATYGAFLGRIVHTLRERYPEIDLELTRMTAPEQWAAFEAGRIDASVGYFVPPAGTAVAHERLVDATLAGVILPASHLVAARSAVRLRDLTDYRWLEVRREVHPHVYDMLVDAVAERGYRAEPQTGHLSAPLSSEGLALLAQRGWTLSSRAVGRTVPSTIAYVEMADPPIPFWLSMFWKPDALSPTVEMFLEIARAEGARSASDLE